MMDTKSMIDLYLEEVRGCKDDSLLLTEEQLAELQREYQAQCQEVERLKAKLDRLQTRVIEITGRK